MRWFLLRSVPVVGLLAWLLTTASPAPQARAEGDPNAVNFEKDVLPFLTKNCASCHDARKKKADYRLDVRKLAFAGGESKHAATRGVVELIRQARASGERELVDVVSVEGDAIDN